MKFIPAKAVWHIANATANTVAWRFFLSSRPQHIIQCRKDRQMKVGSMTSRNSTTPQWSKPNLYCFNIFKLFSVRIPNCKSTKKS